MTTDERTHKRRKERTAELTMPSKCPSRSLLTLLTTLPAILRSMQSRTCSRLIDRSMGSIPSAYGDRQSALLQKQEAASLCLGCKIRYMPSISATRYETVATHRVVLGVLAADMRPKAAASYAAHFRVNCVGLCGSLIECHSSNVCDELGIVASQDF